MNIQHNVELKPYNSLKTSAKAKLFCAPKSVDELSQIIKLYPNEKKLVVGAGYNLFFTKNFDGLIIHPQIKGIKVCCENDSIVDIEACAAEVWDDFVGYCVANNFSGVENLSDIPSSVGAAPVQNIGAYGSEVEDVVKLVRTININTGTKKDFTNEMCKFEYRNSIFKQTGTYIITSVVFQLKKDFTYTPKYIDVKNELTNITNPSMSDIRNAIINIRSRKLPQCDILPNAGSFFKNPFLTYKEKQDLLELLPNASIHIVDDKTFKTSAAYLIEKAGFRNKRKKNVGTYEHHALILVNYGTEKGEEIVAFMKEIQHGVYSKFNVWLEPEVRIY